MGPGLLLQVHEHALLQVVLAVADCDAVVVPVQPMNQRLPHIQQPVSLQTQYLTTETGSCEAEEIDPQSGQYCAVDELMRKGRGSVSKQEQHLSENLRGTNSRDGEGVVTWMLGLLRWPRLEVVCRGSWPSIIVWGLINLHR